MTTTAAVAAAARQPRQSRRRPRQAVPGFGGGSTSAFVPAAAGSALAAGVASTASSLFGRWLRRRRRARGGAASASAGAGALRASARSSSDAGSASFRRGDDDDDDDEDEEIEDDDDDDDDDEYDEDDVDKHEGAHRAVGVNANGVGAEAEDNSILKPDFAPAEARPEWAPDWLPSWLYRMPPLVQLGTVFVFYLFHLLVLSRHAWAPPRFLQPLLRSIVLLAPMTGAPHADPLDKPNAEAASESLRAIAAGDEPVMIGYDSLAGAAVLLIVLAFRLMKRSKTRPLLPPLLNPSPAKGAVTPWQVPREVKAKLGLTTFMLIGAYLLSGYGSVLCEQLLYLLSIVGVPLTVPTLRAYKVLLGHLMWVVMGVKLLGTQLRPFFPPNGKWIRARVRANWCWWAIGVYFVSSLLFNVADFANHFVVPEHVLNAESVVSKLIHPENQDAMAMLVGSIGPCVTAPVFEELLYRGFLLPALACFLPLWLAIPASSVLFAAHHLNLGGMLPLSVLGWAWALAYLTSGNLVVCAITHAMWNARVFLSALLGIG